MICKSVNLVNRVSAHSSSTWLILPAPKEPPMTQRHKPSEGLVPPDPPPTRPQSLLILSALASIPSQFFGSMPSRTGFPVTTTFVPPRRCFLASANPRNTPAAHPSVLTRNLVASPGRALDSCRKTGILSSHAAKHVGTVMYPPVPTTAAGLLLARSHNALSNPKTWIKIVLTFRNEAMGLWMGAQGTERIGYPDFGTMSHSNRSRLPMNPTSRSGQTRLMRSAIATAG
mmetsp:Transcript_826/g.2428  ORF Transcript_826/g.2428 Transcript_826/m.2428 type:complete len:229 (-) Transcript_826:1167-1853(-)